MNSQSEDPNPTKPTHRSKEQKEKTEEDEKEESSSGQHRNINPALKTSQSYTIEHAATEIVP